jgi:type IV pilus assembly protein PilC
MPEFRIEGISMAGKAIQGIIDAENGRVAKQKAHQMATQRKFKLIRILPRAVFMYKVQRGGEKPILGEQKAFTQEEVHEALSKMGFHVISVRKKILSLKLKPPNSEIVTFVRVSADLIRQKLPYNEILQLMVNDIENHTLRDSIKEINNELKQGKDSEKVFVKQEAVIGRFAAHMLGLASKSGNMAEIYDSTAKFLERRAEFKKNMKSALIMPIVTLIALFGACVYYIGFIFPSMAEVFVRLKVDMHQFPMTYASLQMSYFLQDNILLILVALLIPTLFGARF